MSFFKLNPIKLFVFLVLIAFSLGLGVKTFLRSHTLNTFIKERLLVSSSKHSKLSYEDFEVYISEQHLLPTVVLQVNQLKFNVLDKCKSEINILAEKVFAPVNLIKAIWKQEDIKFSLVIEKLQIDNNKLICKDKRRTIDESSYAKSQVIQNLLDSLLSRYPRLKSMSNKIGQRVTSAQIDTLTLNNNNYPGNPILSRFVFQDVKITFDTGSSLALVKSKISWDSFYSGRKSLNIPKFKLNVSENSLRLDMMGKFNEGHMTFQSEVLVDQKKISSGLNIKQLPLNELNTFLSKLGLTKLNFSSNLSWLSCKVKIAAQVSQLFTTNHTIDKCLVVGELGEWQLSDYKFRLLPLHLQPNPILVTVKKSRIRKVIDLFDQDFNLDYITRFGLFSGEVKWLPKSASWQLLGKINNTRILFQSFKKKYEQIIKSIDLKIIGHQQNFNLSAQNFKLNEGSAVGEVNYKFVSNDKSGVLAFDFSSFAFPKKLQQDLLFGQTQFHNIKAKGSYDNGRLNLLAKMDSNSYQSDFLEIGPYQLKFIVNGKEVVGDIQFSSIALNEKTFSHPRLELSKVMSKEFFNSSVLDGSLLSYQFNNKDYTWNFLTGKKNGLKFNIYGFTQDKVVHSSLKMKIKDKSLVWQWEGFYDGDMQLKLKEISSNIEKYKTLGPQEKDIINKALSAPLVGSESKYQNLIKKAQELEPVVQ